MTLSLLTRYGLISRLVIIDQCSDSSKTCFDSLSRTGSQRVTTIAVSINNTLTGLEIVPSTRSRGQLSKVHEYLLTHTPAHYTQMKCSSGRSTLHHRRHPRLSLLSGIFLRQSDPLQRWHLAIRAGHVSNPTQPIFFLRAWSWRRGVSSVVKWHLC